MEYKPRDCWQNRRLAGPQTNTEVRMSDGLKLIGTGIVMIAGVLGLIWLVQGNQFFLYRTFAPKYEQVRRETFEQSKAHRQGMIQELQNMAFQYAATDADHRAALGDLILHRSADVDPDAIPPELARFIGDLRKERLP